MSCSVIMVCCGLDYKILDRFLLPWFVWIKVKICTTVTLVGQIKNSAISVTLPFTQFLYINMV